MLVFGVLEFDFANGQLNLMCWGLSIGSIYLTVTGIMIMSNGTRRITFTIIVVRSITIISIRMRMKTCTSDLSACSLYLGSGDDCLLYQWYWLPLEMGSSSDALVRVVSCGTGGDVPWQGQVLALQKFDEVLMSCCNVLLTPVPCWSAQS